MPTCLRCNWVLNSPIKGIKLSELIGGVLQWLEFRDVKNINKLRKRLFRMIENYKIINNDTSKTLTLCRHCLMESISLLVPEKLESEFKKTFIDVYFFDSVIY